MSAPDVEQAKARITEAFPDFSPDDVRYFAEGHDFRMFQADATWLFRFPKRPDGVLRLAREVALLDRLAGRCMAVGHVTYGARVENELHLDTGLASLGRIARS